ncbi:ClpP-like prohead protease/major capsid protein fusion protein [Polaromonas sp.]|uniref:ClpP-like prohead protease/major capsid protein fusion protein n=1 Tax=Polaromonas sp. TaxID=1869339 RepID=UPI003564CBCD
MKTKATWYSIRRKTAIAAALAAGVVAAAEIHIYGDIGESWWGETVSAKDFVAELAELDVEAITVRINSIGGSVPDGLAIYNAIRRHKAAVTIEVDGMAFSIASLIAMAGDKVNMAKNAMLMIHAPWTYAGGNSKELRELADTLDTWAAAMSTSYAARTGDQPAMLALLTDGKDHYYTAEQCLAEKFIDAITDDVPPAAMASAAAAFGVNARYRDVPADFLQAGGGEPAAAPAAQTSVADATQTQESDMKKSLLALAALRLLAPAGAGGSDTGGTGAGGAPAAPSAEEVRAAAATARTEILAADRTRRAGIEASFKPHMAVAGTSELMARLQNDDAITVEAAGLQLLANLGAGVTAVAGGGQIRTVEDERDKFRAGMEQSILARGSIVLDKAKGAVRADASNPYRGAKLLDVARACLVQAGIRTDGMDQMQIVGAAFTQSTSDFPVLLGNVMHKTLLAAYAIQPDTWTRFCARGSVSDFRAHNRYRTGSLSNLDVLNELGEFKNKAIPDGEKGTITAATKGNIINISRQIIINDDLGAFLSLATAFGRAGKRTVEADVYASLASNAGLGPTLVDGKAMFHADHLNTGAGAPTVDNFDAGRVVMSAQKDVGGNDYLALTPNVWLGPESLRGNALVVVNSAYDPDAANKLQRANKVANLVGEVVGTPRLTGLPWYFFADPAVAAVMEVAFLDGNDTPYLEMQTGFDQDGVRWKARLDYGVAGVDYRGGYRSTGA